MRRDCLQHHYLLLQWGHMYIEIDGYLSVNALFIITVNREGYSIDEHWYSGAYNHRCLLHEFGSSPRE